MNIGKIQNLSFGKKPLLNCSIKNKDTKKKIEATLYSMDYRNPNDRFEMENADNAEFVKHNFLAIPNVPEGSKFYLLKNNETGETVSCAQTTKHFSNPEDNDFSGSYVLIESAQEKPKYQDSISPVLGQIVKDAYYSFDNKIVSALRDEDLNLVRYKFTLKPDMSMVLPDKRFVDLLDKIEKINEIEYMA